MSLLQMSVSAGVMIAVITIIRALTISRLSDKINAAQPFLCSVTSGHFVQKSLTTG